MGSQIGGQMAKCLGQLGVHQPDKMIWQDSGQLATILCNIVVNCSPPHTIEPLWFVFDEHSHRQIDLRAQPLKYSLAGNSLSVHSLQANDSGVYHCAATIPGSKHPGAQEIAYQGTTLVVRGADTTVVWHVLLWFLLGLLLLYSLALLVLIIRKKTGQRITICRQPRKTDAQTSSCTQTKRAQFRAVVQELYTRRGGHISHRHGPGHTKVQSHQSTTPTDDAIYQNV